MDLTALRNLLRPLVVGRRDRQVDLPGLCEQLGLPRPPDEGTKAERLSASFIAVPDEHLPEVAARCLVHLSPPASLRNTIEDLVWARPGGFEIPKRFRRDLARSLEVRDLFIDTARFDQLLHRLWILDGDLLSFARPSLGEEVERHVYRNPGDWDVEHLFERLGAFDSSTRRFVLFLEGLVSPDVRPDEPSQRRFVAKANESLRGCGVELRETGADGGYPVFAAVSLTSGVVARPKNLIFASPNKPDIRFRDAVSNDIEIVTNEHKVLVYDRPIGAGGLRWSDLQAWWAAQGGIQDPAQAKETLYRRLSESLPRTSPPQRFLFRAFFEIHRDAVPDLPALLPEVWLHWDPQTARQRGPRALPRFRMDFLMLFPAGVRVVIEVDGQHHYASDGRADPRRYAVMVAADRDLRLAGYEVYRFGATELVGDAASETVRVFFEGLFRRHRVQLVGRSRGAGCDAGSR